MIVVSDLEGTLTEGATWRAMGEYLKQKRSPLAYRVAFAAAFPRFLLARLKLIDEQSTKSDWLITLLRLFKGATEAEFQAMAEWVVEQDMWPKRRRDVIAEFEQHRRNGARIVIASGTYQAIADAFARRMGAEGLGSAVEFVDGSLSGRITGEVSVREIKARRAREHVGGAPIDFAYGDTTSDIPLLELASQPVAVYPDSKFRRIAAERGWRVMG